MAESKPIVAYEFDELEHALSTRSNGFLHSMTYTQTDTYWSHNYLKDHIDDVSDSGGHCSAVVRGNTFGRNLDWTYDNHCSIRIHDLGHDGHGSFHSFIGFVNTRSDLTKEVVESHVDHPQYNILPYLVVDGINDQGFCICANVCEIYDENGNLDITDQRTSPDEVGLCCRAVVSELLRHCVTIGDARSYMSSQHVWGINTENTKIELHWIMSDKNGLSYILEYKNNVAQWNPLYEQRNFITNYKQSRDLTRSYGMGFERADIIMNNEDTDIDELMKMLWYTNSYESYTGSDPWLSELNDRYGTLDLHQGCDPSEYEPVKQIAIQRYNDRDRSTGLTWNTNHTTIYDRDNKEIRVYSQEVDEPITLDISHHISDEDDFKVVLFDPNIQFKNLDDNILVNGKLNVYDGDSSILSDIWNDEWAETPLTQPVRTDSNGRCEIYVTKDKVYRLEVRDHNDVLLWTRTGRAPLYFLQGVIHNDTLVGNGTMKSELGVNTEVIATVEGLEKERQERIAADQDLQEQIDNWEVHHDETLSGNGTEEHPLGVVSGGSVGEVKHDETLSGKGTEEELLGVVWPDHVTGKTFEFTDADATVTHGPYSASFDSTNALIVENSNNRINIGLNPNGLIKVGEKSNNYYTTIEKDQITIKDDNRYLIIRNKEEGLYPGGISLSDGYTNVSSKTWEEFFAPSITEVYTDDTLSGNGSEESPLGVSPLVSLATESPITNRTVGNQLIIGIESTALMPEVKHDDTLSGNGTDDSPLGVISAGMAEVHHDSNLSGDGTTNNPLGLNSVFEVKSENYGEGNYDRFVYGKDENDYTGPYLIKEWNSTSNPDNGTYTLLHVDPGVMLWQASSYDSTSTASGNVAITTGDINLYGRYADGTRYDYSFHSIGAVMDSNSANWDETYSAVNSNSAKWNSSLSSIEHDNTLSGDGTSESPLGVVGMDNTFIAIPSVTTSQELIAAIKSGKKIFVNRSPSIPGSSLEECITSYLFDTQVVLYTSYHTRHPDNLQELVYMYTVRGSGWSSAEVLLMKEVNHDYNLSGAGTFVSPLGLNWTVNVKDIS